ATRSVCRAAGARLLLMARTSAIALTGTDLTIDHVWAVALDEAPASMSDEAKDRVRPARELAEPPAREPARTYGVNTGFGRLVSKTIPPELADELQVRLLKKQKEWGWGGGAYITERIA